MSHNYLLLCFFLSVFDTEILYTSIMNFQKGVSASGQVSFSLILILIFPSCEEMEYFCTVHTSQVSGHLVEDWTLRPVVVMVAAGAKYLR